MNFIEKQAELHQRMADLLREYSKQGSLMHQLSRQGFVLQARAKEKQLDKLNEEIDQLRAQLFESEREPKGIICRREDMVTIAEAFF